MKLFLKEFGVIFEELMQDIDYVSISVIFEELMQDIDYVSISVICLSLVTFYGIVSSKEGGGEGPSAPNPGNSPSNPGGGPSDPNRNNNSSNSTGGPSDSRGNNGESLKTKEYDPEKEYSSDSSTESEHPGDVAYATEHDAKQKYDTLTHNKAFIMETAQDLQARRPVAENKLGTFNYLTENKITGPNYVDQVDRHINQAKGDWDQSKYELMLVQEEEERRRNNRNS